MRRPPEVKQSLSVVGRAVERVVNLGGPGAFCRPPAGMGRAHMSPRQRLIEAQPIKRLLRCFGATISAASYWPIDAALVTSFTSTDVV
jgi:hypothetical protein